MSTSNKVAEEPEDILSRRMSETTETTEESVESSKVEEKDGSELTAAAALTSLVGGASLDCQAEDDDAEDEEDGKEFNIPQRYTKSGRKRAVSFVLKLMKVLSSKEYKDIIAWMPSGKSFTILNAKAFVAEVLPLHFKNAKYSSFTRKLHRWGFMRHYRGDEAGAFFHKNFQKDRLDLVEKMSCYKPEASKAVSAVTQRKTESVVPSVPAAAPVKPQPIAAPRRSLPVPPTALPPLHRSLHRPMPTPVQAPAVNRLDLNVAIEMEVARRLKERIDAASMSRHALAMMQHQLKSATTPSSLNMQQRFVPWNQQTATGVPRNNLPMDYKYADNFSQRTPLFTPAPLGDTPTLKSLPRTNIQGAKTA